MTFPKTQLAASRVSIWERRCGGSQSLCFLCPNKPQGRKSLSLKVCLNVPDTPTKP